MLIDNEQSAGRRAASDYLRQLLLKPGSYRQSWERHVVRARQGTINQLAVAEVLARHASVRATGQAAAGPSAGPDLVNGERAPISPHQLKDTVARALSGRLLSRPALAAPPSAAAPAVARAAGSS